MAMSLFTPTLYIAFALSLVLFSLTIIEVLPISTRFNITFIYRAVIWVICIHVVVVIPSLVGAAVAFSLRNSSGKRQSTWKRFAQNFFRIVFKSILFRSCACRTGTQQNTFSVSNRSLSVFGGALGVLTAGSFFRLVGPMVVQQSEIDTTLLSTVVSWICAVGLLGGSLLNGFGSVSLPYTYLSGMFLQQIQPGQITKVESIQTKLIETLEEKRKELKLEVFTLSSTPSGTSSRSSFTGTSNNIFSKSAAFFASSFSNNTKGNLSDLGDELDRSRRIINTEIVFMEVLLRETTLDLEELRHAWILKNASQTKVGQIKSLVGVVFAAILVVRCLVAGYSIWTLFNTDYTFYHHRGKSKSDIITTTLLWVSGHHSKFSQNRYNMLSQLVSLLITAVLSFTQVRTLLRTVSVIHCRLSRFFNKPDNNEDANNVRASSETKKGFLWWFVWQIIPLFLICYSLACIVLIKMMLPEKFSVAFWMALDKTETFTIHSSLINGVFFSSATVSAAILGILLRIQQHNIMKHTSTNSGRICSTPNV